MEYTSGIVLLALRIALAVSLYIFLFYALRLVWKELTNQADLPNSARKQSIKFSFKQNTITPQELIFSETNITIGKDSGCTCPLPNDTVSSIHARVFYKLGQWWIEDLNSSNGTILNDTRVMIPTVITEGDTIQVGEIRFKLNFITLQR